MQALLEEDHPQTSKLRAVLGQRHSEIAEVARIIESVRQATPQGRKSQPSILSAFHGQQTSQLVSQEEIRVLKASDPLMGLVVECLVQGSLSDHDG